MSYNGDGSKVKAKNKEIFENMNVCARERDGEPWEKKMLSNELCTYKIILKQINEAQN